MRKISTISLLCLFFLNLNAQDHHVRIGFLGNSITIGSGLSNATKECYPSQIALLLEEKYGDTCIIGNYAVSGRTMLKNGDYPLWITPSFERGWLEAPDICFILLGTNDTKPYNWDVYGNEFHPDYLSMMDTFKLRNPNVKFIICYPPPAFDVVWDIRNEIVLNGVIPVVDTVLTQREAILIDFYNPLIDSVHLFPDKIHPNAQGAQVMAKIAFDKIVESDIIHQTVSNATFVTHIETDNEEIRKGDSATISWVSRNATEVHLNGKLVEATGNIKVAPESNTNYWLVAKGTVNTDSLMVQQLVYLPELTKIDLKPKRVTLNKGEEINFEATFYDQKMKKFTDETFDPTWKIIEGGGSLENKTNNSVTFNADEVGVSTLQIAVNDITSSITITIEGTTSVEGLNTKKTLGYPNPCSDNYFVPIGSSSDNRIEIAVYNTSGQLVAFKKLEIERNNNNATIDTEALTQGVYFYHLVLSDRIVTGKFIKK